MRLLRIVAPISCLLAVMVTRPAPLSMFALSAAEQVLHRTLGHDNIVCRIYLDPHDKFTRVVSPQVSNAVLSNAMLSTRPDSSARPSPFTLS